MARQRTPTAQHGEVRSEEEEHVDRYRCTHCWLCCLRTVRRLLPLRSRVRKPRARADVSSGQHSELHKDMLREFIYTGRLSSPVAGGDLDMGTRFLVIMATSWADESIREAWSRHLTGAALPSPRALAVLIEEAMALDKLEGATVGRYGILVPFLPLSEEDSVLVLSKMVEKWVDNLVESMPVDTAPELLRFLYQQHYDPKFGMRRVFDTYAAPLLEHLMRGALSALQSSRLQPSRRLLFSFLPADASGKQHAQAQLLLSLPADQGACPSNSAPQLSVLATADVGADVRAAPVTERAEASSTVSN